MKDYTVLIVGYGVVGQRLSKELSALEPDIVDKYKDGVSTKRDHIIYDFTFICVDTPSTKEYVCDITEVRNAIYENPSRVYIIKSTVLPGTTHKLAIETKQRIVFSPEYYGATQHCNYDFDFTVLGGSKGQCELVQQLLQDVYDARHKFRITDSSTAELLKYMENSYLGVMVSFCVQFYELAEKYDVSYEELRELFLLDPRTNPSHTFVYRTHPYWNSHCLSKDIPAIAEDGKAKFLKSLLEYNEYCKEKL